MAEMESIRSSNQMSSEPLEKCLNDERLVAQAKAGSEDALAELWCRHGKRTCSVVRRIVRNQEDAEDVLQEAYLKSFLRLQSFSGEAQFSTWLTRIAINTAFMLLRRRRCRPEAFPDSAESDPSVALMNLPDNSESMEALYTRTELRRQLNQAVQYLPLSQRCLIELRCKDELSLREIARRTGLSEACVKARLFRARRALSKLLPQGRICPTSHRRHRRPRGCHDPAPPFAKRVFRVKRLARRTSLMTRCRNFKGKKLRPPSSLSMRVIMRWCGIHEFLHTRPSWQRLFNSRVDPGRQRRPRRCRALKMRMSLRVHRSV
jgi:RNA polymerase sigma factor (sigma-70 family)